MQSVFDSRAWLLWLVKVRILILTLLLGIELAIAQFTPTTFSIRFFVNSVLLWYAVSVFYLLLLPLWEEYRIQSLLQVVSDVVMVTLVVYATGGVDSSLNFLYPLVIIVACILLPQVWAYLIAALAFILYGGVLDLAYLEIIRPSSSAHIEFRALQAIIFVNLFAYLGVAYLGGVLANKLRQVDVKLKHTSGALQNLRALHENIIESISSGLITTGLDGHITLVNTAAARLLERSEPALVGQSIQSLFMTLLPLAGPVPVQGEVRLVTNNNFRKTFRVAVSSLTVPEKGTLGHVYTLDDLTEIRRLEREVRMQDKLAAVGRLAAAIAHEIRNPLTSIAGSVSMLTEVPNLNPEQKQLLEIVTRESERLNAIITDFLAYSRTKQYQYAVVDLLPLLQDTLTLLQNRLAKENTGIQIKQNYQVQKALARVDGDKLKQVFWNISENAVRAMKSGGTLTVSIMTIGEDWQIGFADTGPGINPQLIEKIFEPFQSQFEGGTGLGLAIVYQIMQAHDGKVWARSKQGQGCEFVLRLQKAVSQESVIIPEKMQLNEIQTAAAAGGANG
ncbi:MAG TPA: ATP-binding protein [Terriglobales bacterium]|jgi:two-component system sensor histidine kinase PilS (NtrC family)